MQAVSLGYLTLPAEDVSSVAWEVSVGDTPLADGNIVAEDWTYYDDVYIKCSFQLDVGRALRRLGLPPSARLGAVLIARAAGTPLILTSDIRDVRSGRQQIYLTVPGSQVSRALSLELHISLLDCGHTAESPFAPKRLGNTVFRVDRKVLLEGVAPRLPMLPVSFADHGIGNSSLWWLRLTTRDLMASAPAAIWLWLNVDNSSVSRMLEDSESGEAEIWLRFLEIDFMRQLLREALSNDDLSLQIPYPEESLGHLLSSLVGLLGNSLEQLRQRYKEDPGRVEAELQAKISGG